MTVSVRPARRPHAVPVTRGLRSGFQSGAASAALVFALSCLGVVLVAVSYALARAGHGGAQASYWIGQLLVFVPVPAWLLIRRRVGTWPAWLLVIGLALNQYLQKVCYSPDQLRFPDELQHWVATTTLLDTGKLFQPNPGLPPAVHFPALESMGAAVSALTGVSVATAGLLVAGVAHLVLVAALFAMIRAAGGSARLAGLALVVYATGLHYLFFDSMYIYQTAALPFLVIAVWASRRWRWSAPGTAPFAVIGVLSVLAVTVSHHVTAVATVATLALLALCERLAGKPTWRSTGILAGVALLTVAGWLSTVARDVLGYLGTPVKGALAGIARLFGGGADSNAAPTVGSSTLSLAVQALCLLALLMVFGIQLRVAVRARTRDPWRWALLAGAFAFFAGGAVRFLGAPGPELAGRLATFTYIPMSILTAGLLLDWRIRYRGRPEVSDGTRARRRTGVTGRWRRWVAPAPIGLALLILLLFGARLGGWPADFARLPGPYVVSGYERAIEPTGIAAARWSRDWLGTQQRIAADLTGGTLAGTYGGADPVTTASALFDDRVWGFNDEQALQDLAINYVWVDSRLGSQPPVSGTLFLNDPQAGQRTTALSPAQLGKFDTLTNVSRVYDNGTIRIYDVGRV